MTKLLCFFGPDRLRKRIAAPFLHNIIHAFRFIGHLKIRVCGKTQDSHRFNPPLFNPPTLQDDPSRQYRQFGQFHPEGISDRKVAEILERKQKTFADEMKRPATERLHAFLDRPTPLCHSNH
ncbi:hypothetical protein PSDT_0700 [Parascardovia denticolens DSM 10105 = JCM 12538]|uniref:hypothetical protein n=1 Tax=Parascardovia denticolens TaxID=78258 RepID=UPI00038FF968|nr:hypothetical protein [Parascardovia denticolens]EQW45042.1 hypothetical protein HMPREF9017_01576 [Parascardovia denticolens F0305]BAR05219.1 hypothetical protein PSDT_0700 [Parascardovia denticolens DSM 10105 = JCM 12538]